MRLDSPVRSADGSGTRIRPRDAATEPDRVELIVDGERRPVCAPNRVLLESGRFWSGYRLELLRIPTAGILERVSTPHHRIVFVAGGTCDVRYRADALEGRHRLSPGTFCFVSRGYVFDRLSWNASRFESIIVDIADFDTDPNPIDAFGRTDALFDMYMGIEDARVATLIELMRAEIEAGCPTGSGYGIALSLALAARVASLCATIPSDYRQAATLSSRQLERVGAFIRTNLGNELTIDRLAVLVNMSPFHFARCFKQTTGLTPHQFVTRERIERAKAMLAQGRQPIGDIALAVGFSSQSHFADVYRRVTGTSPRRARNCANKR
ncbi:MAG TPA: AraC family transcriptional regulator [Casimicrobiaceae bacterium]|nr:AraC family transcriptional regulator [Casimicrobiaceae bacterium]